MMAAQEQAKPSRLCRDAPETIQLITAGVQDASRQGIYGMPGLSGWYGIQAWGWWVG